MTTIFDYTRTHAVRNRWHFCSVLIAAESQDHEVLRTRNTKCAEQQSWLQAWCQDVACGLGCEPGTYRDACACCAGVIGVQPMAVFVEFSLQRSLMFLKVLCKTNAA